jgi:hypothetical protein
MKNRKTGYNPIRFLKGMVAAPFCTALGLIISCTSGPLQSEKNFPIVLTLDDKTNTRATFSGKPITAFCTFRDSVVFPDIAWHLGSGKIIRPRDASSKMKAMQVQLFWDVMPLRKDTLGNYFDSVYLSMGGENYRSNGACVIVTNVPPVIDSVKIGRRLYGAQDTIRDTIKAYDTLATMLIRIFARDVNQNALASTWSGSGIPRITGIANSINANYLLPHARTTDTLNVTVYDRQGGNCDKVLFITSIFYKNRPPIIDSVRVKDTVFSGSSTSSLYAAAVFDSLHFKVWPRDSDAFDNIRIQWANKNAKQAVVQQKGPDMTWACTSAVCRDTLKTGSARTIDTVTVTVNDNDSIGATKTIIIVKGRLISNKPPVFDSLLVNDSLFRSDTALFSFRAAGQDSLVVRLFAHDPDTGDVLKDTLYSSSGTQVKRLAAMRFQFVCPDSTYCDTLTAVVRDAQIQTSVRKIAVDIVKR